MLLAAREVTVMLYAKPSPDINGERSYLDGFRGCMSVNCIAPPGSIVTLAKQYTCRQTQSCRLGDCQGWTCLLTSVSKHRNAHRFCLSMGNDLYYIKLPDLRSKRLAWRQLHLYSRALEVHSALNHIVAPPRGRLDIMECEGEEDNKRRERQPEIKA